jgi:hypothetical protein
VTGPGSTSRGTWGAAAAPEARGPLGPRHRWSLWTDGRWPHLKLRFLEGAAPWDPLFASVVHGVGPSTRGPYAAASLRPQGRPGWITACGLALRGLVGAIGWSSVSPPVRREGRCGRALRAPLPDFTLCPFGGRGPLSDSVIYIMGDAGCPTPCYLVDSASSHMLVSKIKPCMSKYKHFIL